MRHIVVDGTEDPTKLTASARAVLEMLRDNRPAQFTLTSMFYRTAHALLQKGYVERVEGYKVALTVKITEKGLSAL